MKTAKYKYLKGITSDVMFEAYGKTPKELLENAAEAMFETICKKGKISTKKKIIVKVQGKDLKDLLFNWLQQLIAQVDIQEMFFSKFDIKKISETSLEAEVFGESISPAKGGTLVKALSYHDFGIKKGKEGYVATVTMDI